MTDKLYPQFKNLLINLPDTPRMPLSCYPQMVRECFEYPPVTPLMPLSCYRENLSRGAK